MHMDFAAKHTIILVDAMTDFANETAKCFTTKIQNYT